LSPLKLKIVITILTAIACSLVNTASLRGEEPSVEGAVTGGISYTIPDWFKTSFLDLEEDLHEARGEDKHVIVFFHLDECPYCARMLEENFRGGQARDFMQERFEVIALNVLGDLPVVWLDGRNYLEKELAENLKVVATPTIVFLDFDGDKVLQLNGYRDPGAYRNALEYVDSRKYQEVSYSDYLEDKSREAVYEFQDHPNFERISYFKELNKPLAVIFEDKYCGECDRFHRNTLNHPDVMAALEKFFVVRLDAEADQRLVDTEGRVTTSRQWARDLGLTFRPSLVLFNNGEEMFRADGLLYHHHLTEALVYVSDGHWEYATLDEFKDAYRAELVRSGKGVDFSE
jgi:thioredoxin-related protein